MAAVVAEGEQWLLPLEGGPRRPGAAGVGASPVCLLKARAQLSVVSRGLCPGPLQIHRWKEGREAAGARWTELGHRPGWNPGSPVGS